MMIEVQNIQKISTPLINVEKSTPSLWMAVSLLSKVVMSWSEEQRILGRVKSRLITILIRINCSGPSPENGK